MSTSVLSSEAVMITSAPHTEHTRSHDLSLSVTHRPVTTQATSTQDEVRALVTPTLHSLEIVLHFVGSSRGSPWYTNLHGHYYVRYFVDHVTPAWQLVRARRHDRVPDIFIDDLGG